MTTMHQRQRIRHAAGLMLAAGTAWAGNAAAHGAGFELVPDAQSTTLRFSYTAGQPVDGAAIRVLSPPDERLHQIGRTDLRGQFSFVPDRPGNWIVEADDESGHKLRAEVSIAGDGMASADSQTSVAVPRGLLTLLLLVSLLLNVGLISARFARTKKGPA